MRGRLLDGMETWRKSKAIISQPMSIRITFPVGEHKSKAIMSSKHKRISIHNDDDDVDFFCHLPYQELVLVSEACHARVDLMLPIMLPYKHNHRLYDVFLYCNNFEDTN